jgi:hypothetical protein
VTLLRDAVKVGTPTSAGRSSQLTADPVRPRVRWTVAQIGECELSGAGSASEQAARRRAIASWPHSLEGYVPVANESAR